ncbi:MAG: TolC family protein, partial [Spirochaetia bacterium]|nr:TolC family protein [Spirochaetia bacterium]
MFFHHFRRVPSAILALFVFFTPLVAEEKVFRSTSEIAEYAASHAPELIQARLELEALSGAKKQSVLGINPVLSGDLGYKEIKNSSGTTTGQGLYYGAGLDFNFEFPSKPIFRKAVAEKNLFLASNALRQMEKEVRSRSVGGLCRLESLRKSLREMSRVRERHESLIRAFAGKASSGPISLLEAMSLETGGLEWDERIRQTAFLLARAESEIGALLGLNGDAAVRLETTLPEAAFPDWSEADLSAFASDTANHHVPYWVKKILHESAKLQTRLARAEGAPDLGLGPVFSGENAGGSEVAFGGKISIPIPVFNANQGRVAELIAREKIAESQAA